MRIVQTGVAYYPSVGGAQLHWFMIARLLREKGHDVAAITQWTDQRNRYLLDSTLFAPWGDDQYDAQGVPVYRFQPGFFPRCWMAPLLPGCFLLPGLFYPPISAYFAWRFKRMPGRVDVVHDIRMGREHFSWAAYAFARQRGARFFITPNFSPRMQSLAGRVMMRNLFRLFRRADGVFVFTPAEQEEMMRLGIPQQRICLIGVGPLLADQHDSAEFKRRFRIRDKMVLFLGQKLRYKGFDVLVAAAPMVWAKHPETSFVFIGPHYDSSRRQILSLGDDRIVDIPRVEAFDPLKASALAAADVFAMPSRQEGIGGVYIEAWAMKKPVIACRIPYLVIEDGVDGFLVEQDANDLAEKIIWLLDHPHEARTMGNKGWAKVQREYNWTVVADRIDTFYRQQLLNPGLGNDDGNRPGSHR
ncbi:MAG TPA: glycosyltransferase family 4 protein [Verrucomicrobiae bacterium]|nr:glycosyltransferase family 4 protein [Verrucomicrobiae bacterium]